MKINFQAYFNEVLKIKKLEVSAVVKFYLNYYYLNLYYTLDGEGLSDSVIFIYHLRSILKCKNFVSIILHIFIFNVYIK